MRIHYTCMLSNILDSEYQSNVYILSIVKNRIAVSYYLLKYLF